MAGRENDPLDAPPRQQGRRAFVSTPTFMPNSGLEATDAACVHE